MEFLASEVFLLKATCARQANEIDKLSLDLGLRDK
jgi:hypothetical protein